jgi:hypothetical protein
LASGRDETFYALHDDHVATLLEEAIYHVEHLRLGVSDFRRAANS